VTPSVPDRLASAVRALTYVVMPALPKEASLAREQVELVIGHLQITLAQYAQTPAFENQEADDFRELAKAVLSLTQGGDATMSAASDLRQTLDTTAGLPALEQTAAIQRALDDLLVALPEDGTREAKSAITAKVLEVSAHRADLDRRWFSLMGFDPAIAEIMQAEA
jgi:hypothetical protein